MRPLRHDLNPAVMEVAHPACQAQGLRILHHEVAEAHALDTAADPGMQPKGGSLTHRLPSGRSILIPVIIIVIVVKIVIIEIFEIVFIEDQHVEHSGLLGEVEVLQRFLEELDFAVIFGVVNVAFDQAAHALAADLGERPDRGEVEVLVIGAFFKQVKERFAGIAGLQFAGGADGFIAHPGVRMVEHPQDGRRPAFVAGAAHGEKRALQPLIIVGIIGALDEPGDLGIAGIAQRFQRPAADEDFVRTEVDGDQGIHNLIIDGLADLIKLAQIDEHPQPGRGSGPDDGLRVLPEQLEQFGGEGFIF